MQRPGLVHVRIIIVMGFSGHYCVNLEKNDKSLYLKNHSERILVYLGDCYVIKMKRCLFISTVIHLYILL